MKRLQHVLCVLTTGLTLTSFATEAICQQKRKVNRPAASPRSKVLSRVRAAELITGHADFKKDSTYDIGVPVGRFWYDWRNIKEDLLDKTIQPLAEKGILTFTATDNSYAMWWKEYVVELRPAGEIESKTWVAATEDQKFMFLNRLAPGGPSSPNARVFYIPVAVRQLVQVTGIAVGAGGTQAEAEFTWKWARTKRAQLLPNNLPPEQLQPSKAFCQLYDDGWRIAIMNLHGLGLP